MSLASRHDGFYDEDGFWRQGKLCMVDCGAGCTCKPPFGVWKRAPVSGEGAAPRRTHELKCWPEPFDAVRRGDKPYEVRRNDRAFEVGDQVLLREWDPVQRAYTGARLLAAVSYLTAGGQCGLPADVCVLGIKDVRDVAPAG